MAKAQQSATVKPAPEPVESNATRQRTKQILGKRPGAKMSRNWKDDNFSKILRGHWSSINNVVLWLVKISLDFTLKIPTLWISSLTRNK